MALGSFLSLEAHFVGLVGAGGRFWASLSWRIPVQAVQGGRGGVVQWLGSRGSPGRVVATAVATRRSDVAEVPFRTGFGVTSYRPVNPRVPGSSPGGGA